MKGLAVVPIEVGDEVQDFVPEIVRRREVAAPQQLADQNTQPKFHLIQPRRMLRRVVEDDLVRWISEEAARVAIDLHWRAGIEGRISVLKRRLGLDRCRYQGEAGMERWVGWGLLAHNLRQISRSVLAAAAG